MWETLQQALPLVAFMRTHTGEILQKLACDRLLREYSGLTKHETLLESVLISVINMKCSISRWLSFQETNIF